MKIIIFYHDVVVDVVTISYLDHPSSMIPMAMLKRRGRHDEFRSLALVRECKTPRKRRNANEVEQVHMIRSISYDYYTY